MFFDKQGEITVSGRWSKSEKSPINLCNVYVKGNRNYYNHIDINWLVAFSFILQKIYKKTI